ncbi:MAG: phosphoglucosamine mutase [Elusimicrobiota bacterium]
MTDARKLFGTDGVRGVAGRWPLTDEFVRRLGWAAGRVLGRKSPGSRPVLVVRDTRGSGPSLQRALSAGLRAAGRAVSDGGVLPTPAVAVLAPRRRCAAGAVISASHNPAEFNGIKFFSPDGTKLPDELELEIEKLALDGEPVSRGTAAEKKYERAADDYLVFLRSTWPRGLDLKGFSMVLDCANGSSGVVAARLFRSLGARVTVLSAAPDGKNINRNCGALHPGALAAAVRRLGADMGAAFDGDADRAMLVDEEGAVRNGDDVLLLAARYLKSAGRLPKNRVVVTVMANLGLRRALSALGIEALETSVGDKYVWQAMRESGAALGGEQSGHIIFREFLSTGDGLLTALQTAAIARASGRPLSCLASLVVRYPQVLLNVTVRERRPLDSLNGFSKSVQSVRDALGGNGRVLIRYSGTEPLLRIMLEGPRPAEIQAHARALAAAVRREGI